MSGYRDLQKIYEAAWSFGPNRNRFFTGNESEISLGRGPGQLPMQSPGVTDTYNRNLASSSNPARFADDEEDTVVGDESISKQQILNKLRDIKQEAIDEGMDYAVFALSSLESYIISL